MTDSARIGNAIVTPGSPVTSSSPLPDHPALLELEPDAAELLTRMTSTSGTHARGVAAAVTPSIQPRRAMTHTRTFSRRSLEDAARHSIASVDSAADSLRHGREANHRRGRHDRNAVKTPR